MIRVFREHPEFGEFTKMDTETGRLFDLTEAEFVQFLPESFHEDGRALQRIVTGDVAVFTGETPETHTRFPRRVYFQITRNCNMSCDYCFIKARKGQPYVPTQAAMEMAAFLGRCGLVEVRLTGGEPTTHPDFFDILNKFREEGVYVSVATNGVMAPRTLDRLCEEKNLWVICSVDGDRKTHNRYRSGSFDVVMGNLRYLKKKRPSIRIRLTTTLTRENKDQMWELGEICRSVDAESITIIPLRPQVRDPRMVRHMVTAQEFKKVIKDLIEVQQKLGIKFTTTLETDYSSRIYKDPVFRKRSSCAAGREGTNLDYDADGKKFFVYGCAYSPACELDAKPEIREPFVAGEFSVDDPSGFLDIWRDENAWTIFRDLSLKSDDCKDCKYYADHRCTGSCQIQNVDFSRIDANGDVLAQLRDQIARTSEWYCYQKIFG